MRKICYLTLLLLMTSSIAFAQCNILPNAVAGIILDYQSTNLFNCSGVGYNPIMNRYYGVRAGNSGFPLETWTSAGGQLYSTTAGFDWRGMWWNPNTNQLEGNGYSTYGMWRADINGSGYALNTGSNIFSGQAQPDAQSCGDYDPIANEVIYYYNGRIYRYSRATNAAISNYALLGCPVAFSNINSTTVVYTGCVGREIGILDYVNKRIYLFQKNTGAYVGMSQLPGTAVTTNSFRFSYANGYAWLFDLGTGNWYSYRILDIILPENALSANTIWMAPSISEITWESSAYAHFEQFEVERSEDGTAFATIGALDASAFASETGALRHWSLQDETVPATAVVYYRVKATTQQGEEHYSEVMPLHRLREETLSMTAWPVPADAAFDLRFQNAPPGSQVDIFDATGKRVFKETLATTQVTDAGLRIDCATWAEGMYMLHLSTPQGSHTTQRLVIQH